MKKEVSMISQKKGQAAMEFLMTYGWAILAAIVAIGVLAYFGVFSPGKLAGSSAILNNPYYASAWQVSSTQNISLEVINNGGDSFFLSEIVINGTGSNSAYGCINRTLANPFNPGVTKLILIPTCYGTPLTVGNNFAGDIQVKYNKVGSNLNQSTTGTIRAPVQ
ncbi:MAG: hypothetical protein ACP5NS_03635 [Candidatus Pacearchaeota archaeon]